MSLDLLARGDIVVDSLVTHRGGLDDIAGALDRVRDKVGLKTIIHPGR
jgi:threonine dehydrogenase-like Zn-dependent dehydrogenase